MRIDDVYVITPYDSSEALTDILESSSYISKISLSSLLKEVFSYDFILKTLRNCIDGHAGDFSFKKENMDIVFKELYSRFKKDCLYLTFDDFCKPFYLSTFSLINPFIFYCDDETGITVGILENFLRMPYLIDHTTFKVATLFSRHM